MNWFKIWMLLFITFSMVAFHFKIAKLTDTTPLILKLERCEVELRAYKAEMNRTLRPNWEDVE